jgi:sulfur-oxidizing protein SoxZ
MMAEQIKLRAQIQGEITELRILLQHPMETGQRKDDKGMSVAVHFIQTFAISHGGKPLIEGQLNTSVSRNPLFAFRVRGIKAGDKLNVSWLDNLGERRQDEFAVG